MSRLFLTTAAAVLLMSGSAMAQGMSSGSMSSDDSMTCQQMMDKANGSSMDSMDASKKAMMTSEMDKAKKSMAAGHEDKCKMHMKKAMGMM